MKKLFPIAMIAVVAVMFTSCKKDYTCTCTYNDNAGTTMTETFTFKDTKSNAQKACTNQATISGAGTSVTWTCKL